MHSKKTYRLFVKYTLDKIIKKYINIKYMYVRLRSGRQCLKKLTKYLIKQKIKFNIFFTRQDFFTTNKHART